MRLVYVRLFYNTMNVPVYKTLVTQDKVKLYYRVQTGKKPFLVFVHGGGGDLTAFDMAIKYLKGNYATLVYDQRGHGFSDRPKSKQAYNLHYLIEDLHQIILKEKITDFILIGQCFGGMIVQAFARKYPTLPKGLLLVTTSAAMNPWKRLMGLNPVFFLGLKILTWIPWLYFKTYKRPDNTKFIDSPDISLPKLLRDWYCTSPGSWAQMFIVANLFDLKDSPGYFAGPVKAVYGKQDNFFSVNDVKQLINYFPQIKFREIATNHGLPCNKPRELAREIDAFIKGEYRGREE